MVSGAAGTSIRTGPILFNSGSPQIRAISFGELDKLVLMLRQESEMRVSVVGHTDNLGSEAVNRQVSAERASAVVKYLVEKGIDPSRLESKGMGSAAPIASNDTQLGRQADRRIEFILTSSK